MLRGRYYYLIDIFKFGNGDLIDVTNTVLYFNLSLKMDRSGKRKAVKKLDFENCEVTTVKFKKKVTRRLKAKVINEYEDELTLDSDSTRNSASAYKIQDSPILFWKGSAKKDTGRIPSPVLITKKSRKKHNSKNYKCLPSTSVDATRSTSPVFSFNKRRRKKSDSGIIQDSPDGLQIQLFCSPSPCRDILIDEDYKDCTGESDCDIEEFTSQELSKEIQSLSSSSISSVVVSEDQSREGDEIPSFRTPGKEDNEAGESKESTLDSGRKRKRHKKGGLVARLVNLRQRQASERRIREHTKKIMKTEENWKKTFHVVKTWRDTNWMLIKCQELKMAQDAQVGENFYMMLNRHLGNSFREIKEGSFLRIAGPWQELRLVDAKILLSVTSLELIDSIPGISTPRTEMLQIPVSKYKEDETSFFSALFNPECNVLLGDIVT